MYRSTIRPLRIVSPRLLQVSLRRGLSESSQKPDVWDKVLHAARRFLPNRTDFGSARSLYFNCKQQAENSLWHTRGKVGTDFRSKQIMLMIHVWMIHKRLITEGREGQRLQEALFDQLWEDTSNRIRAVGIGELSINKYLKGVQGYSFRVCLELDHTVSLLKEPVVDVKLLKSKWDRDLVPETVNDEGILTPAEVHEVMMDELAGTVWRNVYMKREDLPEEHYADLAQYIWSEQQSLMQLSRDAIFEGRVQWGPVPTWGKAVSAGAGGKKGDKGTASPDYKGEWKEATAMDGKTYYWNTLTREAVWEKPKDFVPSIASSPDKTS